MADKVKVQFQGLLTVRDVDGQNVRPEFCVVRPAISLELTPQDEEGRRVVLLEIVGVGSAYCQLADLVEALDGLERLAHEVRKAPAPPRLWPFQNRRRVGDRS